MLIGDSPLGHNSPADDQPPADRVPGRGPDSLGRLCEHTGDRIRIGSAADGIERLEAHLHGQAYSAHRHDTYAIGATLHGQQTFHFRGEQWGCIPGQCHILHPDETHDGGAANDAGFGYRIIYVDPALVQAALGGQPLPFVANPVVDRSDLPEECTADVWDIETELDDIARTDIVVAVARLLLVAASHGTTKSPPLALDRLSRVRDAIAASPTERHTTDALEHLCGLDRWTLARQFRAAFGTSPSRFRTMRQLDCVRRLLKSGASLAEASIDAGFADQSHMSRHFKKAYGLTPGTWISAVT
jgi:AraC-like DNA-binding protein